MQSKLTKKITHNGRVERTHNRIAEIVEKTTKSYASYAYLCRERKLCINKHLSSFMLDYHQYKNRIAELEKNLGL